MKQSPAATVPPVVEPPKLSSVTALISWEARLADTWTVMAADVPIKLKHRRRIIEKA